MRALPPPLLRRAQVTWFEGGYTDYEADRRQRLGGSALSPHRLKFRKLAMA